METAQKSIDFTNTYYFIKFLTKKIQFQRNQNYFFESKFWWSRRTKWIYESSKYIYEKINYIFKQCDMNRLSINAKKDEKSPFPLENNELGMNFKFLINWGRCGAGYKFECIFMHTIFICQNGCIEKWSFPELRIIFEAINFLEIFRNHFGYKFWCSKKFQTQNFD